MNTQELINQYPVLQKALATKQQIETLGLEWFNRIMPEDLWIEMTSQDVDTLISIFGRAELKRLNGMEEEE